jgi:hypothetical protein
MSDGLSTPRSTLRAGHRVRVWCKGCLHWKFADQQKLVDSGRAMCR